MSDSSTQDDQPAPADDGNTPDSGPGGYSPEPINTDGVELNGSLLHLREILAENVHDRWAEGRLAEGWTWGPERNDDARHNPTLVSYADLPDSEREYDRTTAEQTLKAILKLGYRIKEPVRREVLERHVRRARKTWSESGGGVRGVRMLMEMRRDGFHWGSDPKLYLELTGTALAAGDLPLVYELANEGLLHVEDRRCLLQLARNRALAMAHEGRSEEAEQEMNLWLDRCETGTAERRDIASALGRIFKERWYADRDPTHLEQAIAAYRQGFEEGDGDVFPAINVASLHAMGGELDAAREWARTVVDQADDHPWGWASQGEAQVILGDLGAAAECYAKYFAAQRSAPRDIAATRKQALHLLAELGTETAWLDAVLPQPQVLVFAGVVPDVEGEAGEPRFPAGDEERVRDELRARLAESAPVAVFSSAAAGSDIILLEVAHELGVESQILLPAEADEFRTRSVTPFGDRWVERFDAALSYAARVECLSRHFPPESEHALMFRYGNQVLLGAAMLRAQRGGFGLSALAVWDGQPPRGPGGTGEFVAEWNSRAVDNGEWSPATVIRSTTEPPVASAGYRRDAPLPEITSGQEVRAMLFADVKNFSTLTEQLLPQFQNRYMRQVSELLDMNASPPVVVNTWGDAIYMVFDTPRACGEFALAMGERLNAPTAAWRHSDLPEELAIRIAVHAGPAFRLNDPVTREFTYTGSHVTHAARLEPVTQPGQVFATEAFAALAALAEVESFSCHYVGQRQLAKGYGSAGVYRLVAAR